MVFLVLTCSVYLLGLIIHVLCASPVFLKACNWVLEGYFFFILSAPTPCNMQFLFSVCSQVLCVSNHNSPVLPHIQDPLVPAFIFSLHKSAAFFPFLKIAADTPCPPPPSLKNHLDHKAEKIQHDYPCFSIQKFFMQKNQTIPATMKLLV